jgi:hypothetical protein
MAPIPLAPVSKARLQLTMLAAKQLQLEESFDGPRSLSKTLKIDG